MLDIEIYIRTDQPTTCPYCGARTELLFEIEDRQSQTQIHKCLSFKCSFLFIEENDE
jgi:sarcosine oxidase delta subunit